MKHKVGTLEFLTASFFYFLFFHWQEKKSCVWTVVRKIVLIANGFHARVSFAVFIYFDGGQLGNREGKLSGNIKENDTM